jgi:hypothetical protein
MNVNRAARTPAHIARDNDPYPNLRQESTRLARRVSLEMTPAASELFTLLAKIYGKTEWTLGEWRELLQTLDSNDDTVADFLALA